jgi:glycosyltransferase involved in cell wall biosynthesis
LLVTPLKYALVHEWLTPKATGGSELVVREILNQLNADLYALIDFESTNPNSYLFQRRIGTTFLQHFPWAIYGVQKYLPLLPLAIEQLDLRQYDVLISSSHTVAKGILASPQQLHVCYCHTPMRFAWDLTFDYLKASRLGQGLPGILTRQLLHQIRQWDVITANRVDYFIANSSHTARRIWRTYRRQAQVIYPPVAIDRFPFQSQKQEFYLTVSRLVSYKKIDLIIQAFNRLGRSLVVIGTGPELQRLQKLAGPHVTLLGFQSDAVVEDYMAKAQAFVYASCEDFGIALVEAQACGTPVIAYGVGGALETVRDVRQHPGAGTGLLFPEQTVEALVDAVSAFEQLQGKMSAEQIRSHAAQFHPQVFAQRFMDYLDRCDQDFKAAQRC